MTMDSEADRKLVARLRGALQSLKTERSGWERYWLDVKRYFSPGRGRQITGSNSGEANAGWSDEHFRLNGEASRALDILASGIQSGLTSKSRQWFQLENPDPVIGSDHDVRVCGMGRFRRFWRISSVPATSTARSWIATMRWRHLVRRVFPSSRIRRRSSVRVATPAARIIYPAIPCRRLTRFFTRSG